MAAKPTTVVLTEAESETIIGELVHSAGARLPLEVGAKFRFGGKVFEAISRPILDLDERIGAPLKIHARVREVKK